ncbi:MAG: hypothetical protein JWQ98_575 [Chlorobi bacterium]|nr:hypothetical protein [Chlorobiota bacterium]
MRPGLQSSIPHSMEYLRGLALHAGTAMDGLVANMSTDIEKKPDYATIELHRWVAEWMSFSE